MASKSKKGKVIKIVCVCVAGVLVVGAGAIALFRAAEAARQENTSALTYTATEVTEGNVTSSISGSGTLSPTDARTVISTGSGVVEEVYYSVGDTVPAGSSVLKISNATAEQELSELEASLESVESSLASVDQTASSKAITSPAAGRVKLVSAGEGDLVEDVMDEVGYLCLISTDGNMRVTFTPSAEVKKYDTLTLVIGDEEETGTVIDVDGENVTVQIAENTYTVGETAKILAEDGTELGEGQLELGEYVKVTADAGVIASINKEENSTVYRNTTLFTLEDYPLSSTYTSLKEQQASLEEEIEEVQQQLTPSFDVEVKVTDLPVAAGDSLAEGDSVLTVAGLSGFQMTVSVDELDIADVALGQEAAVSVEAVDGSFAGSVTYISNEGVQNGNVTTYSVVVTVEEAEGILPGMSATVEITTQSSEDGLIVPVEAVQTEGEETFVYLAPEGTQAGDVLEDSLDLASLERVSVEAGMSDGLYQQVTGDLAAGDIILVPTRTTTGEASLTEEEAGFGGMPGGAMGGMTMPDSQGGGQMPDFQGGGQRGEAR